MSMRKHGWRCPKCGLKQFTLNECDSPGCGQKRDEPGRKRVAISEGNGGKRENWPAAEVGA
jgi:hypothetical protein